MSEITSLTAKVERLEKLATADKGLLQDDYAIMDAEVARLTAEVERLRMQLTACGVVAMCNSRETAPQARDMHPDYRSDACDCVAGAVDREMAQRERAERAEAALAALNDDYAKLDKDHADDLVGLAAANKRIADCAAGLQHCGLGRTEGKP